MRKLICIISTCLLITILSSCNKIDNKLENMTTKNTKDYVSIVWEGRTYIPFCVIDNDKRGEQIGIVNGDNDDQVFEYRGYSTDNWLISFYKSGEMDNSVLMKEMNVTKIPNNLQPDWEYK